MNRILLILVLFAAGCTEQPEVIPFEYSRVFTGETRKGWTIRNFQYTEEGKATQTGQLDDCLTDDLYIFYANEERRMEILDNNRKCDASDPDLIAEGTWSFSNANATLTLPFPLLANFPLPFIVRAVDDDTMTLEIFLNDNKSSYRFNFRSADLE